MAAISRYRIKSCEQTIRRGGTDALRRKMCLPTVPGRDVPRNPDGTIYGRSPKR